MDYNDHYKAKLFENDIFIFNMQDANFNDIDYIIKGLKALKYEKEKVLVIVTSIMTCSQTKPKYKKEEGGEEEKEEDEEGKKQESEEE